MLIPFGDNQRYDLVVEREGNFVRVQCKTGRVRKEGQILFNTCSSYVHRAAEEGTTEETLTYSQCTARRTVNVTGYP